MSKEKILSGSFHVAFEDANEDDILDKLEEVLKSYGYNYSISNVIVED